jgi:two-component system, NarL family, sensor histidine kinase UhpB
MNNSAAQSSIRRRLILIPSLTLAFAITAVIGVELFGAKSRIALETQSGLTLGDHLIRFALDNLAAAQNSDVSAQNEALERLLKGLARVRHIKVGFTAAPSFPPLAETGPPPKRASPPPAWFLALLEPERVKKSYPVTIAGAPRGEIIMTSEAADELAEIWTSLLFLTGLLAGVSVAIVVLILLTARHTLAPLRQLVDGLDRLGRGQFEAVGEIQIAELRRVGERFNALAAKLARSEADNHLLIDRLLSIQDAERKELARELHDEFGASLFGIRAAASCIIEATSGAPPTAAQRQEIIDRAEKISGLADAIQKQNYRILDRIRPVILHQMGLNDALRQLVGAWGAQHRDFSCAIDMASLSSTGQARTFDEEVSLTSYRIVQECLTNAARHSKGEAVRVEAGLCVGPKGEAELRLKIADDGVGLPADFRYGFGFLGMIERVRKLDGRLNIGKSLEGGALIEAFIPVVQKAPEPPPQQGGGSRGPRNGHS